MIRLVPTQQAPLAGILTRKLVRMPADILVSGAAALRSVHYHAPVTHMQIT